MSTQQRNDACAVTVDPSLGAILRLQTLAVLEANHHHFEDVRDLSPQAQLALSVIYRDAFAVLDALGWIEPAEPTTVAVPMTDGHADQLRRCHHDLGHTNRDRLATLDATIDPAERNAIRQAIEADRAAAEGLDRLLGDYAHAMER